MMGNSRSIAQLWLSEVDGVPVATSRDLDADIGALKPTVEGKVCIMLCVLQHVRVLNVRFKVELGV